MLIVRSTEDSAQIESESVESVSVFSTGDISKSKKIKIPVDRTTVCPANKHQGKEK
jgi:hypothetical protein